MLNKKIKKQISNETYNQAYENIDNRKIINSVLAKYRGILDEDTLTTCGLNALWRCLQSHNDSYKNKFTNSLWRFTHWECRKELQILAKNRYKPSELVDSSVPGEVEYTVFDDIESILEPEYSQLIKLRFLEGRTLKEIGDINGYTKETARQKIDKALSKLKKVYIDVGKDNTNLVGQYG